MITWVKTLAEMKVNSLGDTLGNAIVKLKLYEMWRPIHTATHKMLW